MSNWATGFMEHPARRQHQRRPGLRAAAVRHDVPPRLGSTAATPPPSSTRWRAASTRSTTPRSRRRRTEALTWTTRSSPRSCSSRSSPLTVGITFWASRQTSGTADFYAGGRNFSPAPERPGHRRRLHVRRLVPRHLRRHRAERLRRLPLLHRLPGRLAGRAAARRRDAAQLRPLHDGRPARLPDAADAGADGRGHLDGRRLDLLPARPDGRRRRARRAAARRRQPGDQEPHHPRRRRC